MKQMGRRMFLEANLLCASLPWLADWELLAAGNVLTPDERQKLLPLLFSDTAMTEEANVFSPPLEPSLWPAFRQLLLEWREWKKKDIDYSGRLYEREDFRWVSSSFACCFLMVYDLQFYDPEKGVYRVKELLDDGIRRFGGYDSIVLWQAYPRIGLDPRNQFDFYRDMPGGLEGVRGTVRRFHARNVKVYIPYNPWDIATRREGVDDLEALTQMVGALEADGIFLDTMNKGAAEFRQKLDDVRAGVVLEGEGALPLTRIHDHHMSWAQWFSDSKVPGILRNKWFERRHMQHQIRRWNRNHAAELQMAWMNGSGMLVWENVFGSWVGWNARDQSFLRCILPIQRRYASLFAGEGWTPLVETLRPGIYAGLWEENEIRLWTLVNRTNQEVTGKLLVVPHLAGDLIFDLMKGGEAGTTQNGSRIVLEGTLEPRGFGCFVAGRAGVLGSDMRSFLAQQRVSAQLASRDVTFPALRTNLKPPVPTRLYPDTGLPAEMVRIPGTEGLFKTDFRVRECGFYDSQSEISFTGNIHQKVTLEHQVSLTPYAIDLTPVTNAQFAEFLRARSDQPKHPVNFLKHWENGRPPSGKKDHPVVYVSLEDARAYARWAGKRLPTEVEWQYAALGSSGAGYPWGAEMIAGMCNGGEMGDTTPVTAFPKGRSSFGCYDMIGNTWEWTESEYTDERNRFVILKGGSYYNVLPHSDWYMDGGPHKAEFSAKYLLLWPGLDRAATIGFRCVVDLES
jgi:formylglycine-generating enzyme required for sulfatase activity